MLAMKSNFDARDHLGVAKALALRADVDALRAAHSAWWNDFWGKSLVEVDDPQLMARYYTPQYVMGSASRNPKFPPGILGPWITADTLHIFANGGYWMNYNHAAPFYALYSSNHIEQADPQDAPLLDFMPRGAQYAKDILHTRGLLYPVGIGPLGFDINYKNTQHGGPPNLEADGVMTWGQRSNAAYNLVNMAQRWYTTYDLDYGRKIYPYVIGVVNFWEDYLKLEDDGKGSQRYVIHGDSVQEGTGPNTNPNMSLGLVRSAFTLALDLSRELKVDQARQKKWRDVLAHLSDFPTAERNGKKIFILSEKGPVLWGSNTVHIQHIYPAGQIGLGSDPKLLEIARNTLAAAPRWYDENGSNSFLPMAARIGHDPAALLKLVRGYPMSPNGFIGGNVHGIENCSTVPNTVNEMLMQSHEGVLRFFPVWPKDKAARFRNLRAHGAFLVSAVKRNGELPDAVRIISEKGRNCVVDNPWPGQPVQVFRNGKAAEISRANRFTLKTSVGETLLLGPVGSTEVTLDEALVLVPSKAATASATTTPLDATAPLVAPASKEKRQ
jgi:hypothetical protein